MMATLPNETDTDATRFDALCKVVIYHFCDLMQTDGLNDAVKLLIDQKVMEDEEDAEAAYTEYDELVCEYMLGHLPDGFSRRHDYWGAPCITNVQTWNAPKHDNPDNPNGRVFAAGDSTRIMFFESFLAMQEYTQEKLETIE